MTTKFGKIRNSNHSTLDITVKRKIMISNLFERARNEKHYEMIKDLNGDIEKVRKELSDYKNQVLEG